MWSKICGGNRRGSDHDPPKNDKNKSIIHIILFSMTNYGLTIFIVYYVTIALPSDLMIMVGEREKSNYLAMITMIASIFCVIVNPVVGTMSDRCFDSWIGRRKPFIFIGIILCICSMIARSFFITKILLIAYAAMFSIGKVGYTFSNTPYSGLVPDIYPDNQYGKVSGAIGCTTILGGVTGSLLGFLYTRIPPYAVSLIISLLLIIGTIPVFIIHEPSREELQSKKIKTHPEKVDDKLDGYQEDVKSPRSATSVVGVSIFCSTSTTVIDAPISNEDKEQEELVQLNGKRSRKKIPSYESKYRLFSYLYGVIKPFTYWNYFWVFTIRFLFQLSMGAAQSYFLYYIKDVLGPNYEFFVWKDWIESPQDALAVFMTVVLLFSVPFTAVGGYVSDQIGRKWIAMIGGTLSMITMIGIVAFPQFSTLVLFGISLGIGMGLFYSVDFGLATDVLPNKNESAKDLGIFNLTTQIPQILSPPFAALVIMAGDAMIPSFRNFGYTLLYSVCAFIQLVAVMLILLIRKGGRKAKN